MLIILLSCIKDKPDTGPDTGWVWGEETWDYIDGNDYLCAARGGFVQCSDVRADYTAEFPENVVRMEARTSTVYNSYLAVISDSGNAYSFQIDSKEIVQFPTQHVKKIQYIGNDKFYLLSEDGIIYDEKGNIINQDEVWMDFTADDDLAILTSKTHTVIMPYWSGENQPVVLDIPLQTLETFRGSVICGQTEAEVFCFTRGKSEPGAVTWKGSFTHLETISVAPLGAGHVTDASFARQ